MIESRRNPRSGTAIAALLSATAVFGACPGWAQSDPGIDNPPEQTELQNRTGKYVQTVCGNLFLAETPLTDANPTEVLFRRCTELVANEFPVVFPLGNGTKLDQQGLNKALQDVASDELSATRGTVSTQTAMTNMRALRGRLIALREGATGIQVAVLGVRESVPDVRSLLGRSDGFLAPRRSFMARPTFLAHRPGLEIHRPMAIAWNRDETARSPTRQPAERDPTPLGAQATRLLRIELEETEQRTVVRIDTDGTVGDVETLKLQDPERLVLDLAGLSAVDVPTTLEIGGRHAQRIRIGKHPGKVRVVIDAAGEAPFEGSQVLARGEGLTVELGRATELAPSPAPSTQTVTRGDPWTAPVASAGESGRRPRDEVYDAFADDFVGAAPPDPFGKLGVWVSGTGAWGDYDQTEEQAGFDIENAWGVIGGVDYRFTDELVLGIGGGYSSSRFDFDRSAGDLDKDAAHFALYGNYQLSNWSFDGIVTYSDVDYDLDRSFAYALGTSAPVTGTLSGDTDGDEWAVSLGAGYDFAHESWDFEPYARIVWIRLGVDGYTESGSNAAVNGWSFRYEDQTVRSFTSALGMTVRYAISSELGVFTPYLRGEWEHEYNDDSTTLSARFAADPTGTPSFGFRIYGADRDYANLGGGVAATFARGLSAFVDFETVVGMRATDLYVLSAGARYEF